MSWVQKIFGFQGRMGLGDFWLVLVGLFVLHCILAWYFPVPFIPRAFLTGEDPVARAADLTALMQANALRSLISLALLWPWIAAGVKRCHDRDKSGFWLFVFWIPLIGWLWGFIELGCLAGTPGPNKYGASTGYRGDPPVI